MEHSNYGYLPIPRRLFEDCLWKEDRSLSRFEAWIDLLQTARFKDSTTTEFINGVPITWGRGQLVGSFRFLKKRWGWKSISKVEGYIKFLEKNGKIKTDIRQGITIITICEYDSNTTGLDSQKDTTQDSDRTAGGQQEDSGRTAGGQNSNNGNNVNKERKEKYNQVIFYLNNKTGRNYKISAVLEGMIEERFSEGYTINDFKKVVDNKVSDWALDSKMNKHLTPSTLFSKKHFDTYLNQVPSSKYPGSFFGKKIYN